MQAQAYQFLQEVHCNTDVFLEIFHERALRLSVNFLGWIARLVHTDNKDYNFL